MTDRAAGEKGLAGRTVWEVHAGVARQVEDVLAEETPVAVGYDGVPFAVMMVSPGDLADFAVGFSLTERGIRTDDIVGVEIHELLEGLVLDISTREPASPASAHERLLPGRSGCGICGSRQLEDVVKPPAPVGEGAPIEAAALEAALVALQARQPLNAASGALHAAAWCDTGGGLVLVREDVGRHNALDKLIGAMLRAGTDAEEGFALVTSRASYEMTTKAAAAGFPLLAAMSGPTALAVDLAAACGLTLVGFTRPGRYVIYSHPQRLNPVVDTGR